MLKPILQKLSDNGLIVWENHDVDEERELSQKMGVRSVPTLVFYYDDEIYRRASGFMPEQEILKIYGVDL